jgi:putative intracellular protease/amidase
VLDWPRKVHQRMTWTVSVCIDAVILAATAILKSHPATRH